MKKKFPQLGRLHAWLCFYLVVVFISSEKVVFGVTVPEEVVLAQLNSAELVVDVKIDEVRTMYDPQLYMKTVASAQVLKIHSSKSNQKIRTTDEIEIEFPGGEAGEQAVMFSGFPRPYKGISYKAFLNLDSSGNSNRYQVAGFEEGFKPLIPTRQYSRNRTDGSDGKGTGPFLYWDPRYFPIPYYISAPSFKGHPDYVTAIEDSFKTWRAYGDVKIEFLALGCNQSTQNENDSLNTIILIKEKWPFDKNAIAVTRNFYIPGSDANSGMILDSDILLNGQNYSFTTTDEAGRHDIQNIVTHEAGHFLGFGHEIAPSIDNNATMFASATAGEKVKRTLKTNDLNVLRAAYSGVGEKFDNQNIHCEVPNDNVGCLAVHTPQNKANSYLGVLIYLLFTMGLGRWVVKLQRP